MQRHKKRRIQKEMIGTVVSDKMHKTIVVEVGRLAAHPIFKKTVRLFNKFKVHDEKNAAKIGDTVRIRGTRPLSKDKRWRLVEIIGRTG